MEVEVFALFAALEVALLFAGALFLLYRKYVKLRERLQELPPPATEPENFDSIKSGYFLYLEKELLATQARLEQTQSNADADELQVHALQNRLMLLGAEKQVVESTNDYPDRHWEFVLERFKPVIEESELEPVQEPEDAESQPGITSQSLSEDQWGYWHQRASRGTARQHATAGYCSRRYEAGIAAGKTGSAVRAYRAAGTTVKGAGASLPGSQYLY